MHYWWLFFLVSSCFHCGTATIALASSVDGRQGACPGEVVTYTCTVIQGGSITWTVASVLVDTSVRFLGTSPPDERQLSCSDSTSTVQCADLDYLANLTSVGTLDMNGLVDMTSTFRFTARAAFNGRMVNCTGTTAAIIPPTANQVLNVIAASLPFPPRTPSYNVQQYGRDNVMLTVQWQSPQDDGGAPVSYTITVSPGVTQVTTNVTSASLSAISYNVNYIVSIVATNCIGNSSAIMETFRIVNCSDPATPRNGFIQPYQNTTEGAEIFFRCNSQFVPNTTMMAVCGADARWNPDPDTHVCTFDCGPPPAPPSGSLESYTNTTEGAEVFYSCDPGRVPEKTMMSNCTRGGWSPNPGALSCTIVNCEMPTGPRNGSIVRISGTLVGAKTFFMCDTGFVPAGRMSANCTSDGESVTGIWNPDPSTLICNVSAIDCGVPSNASGEVIVQYNTTIVGSVIVYQCRQSGFAPSSSSAVCMESGRWSPDPFLVVCRMVPVPTPTPTPTANCGVPATPGNGSIETYQDTTEGAEIFFKCNPGFVPAGSMRAVCAGDGRWNPEPAGQRCTASSIVCAAPSFASGIAVESLDNSKVSSEIFYRCQPGLSLEGRITSVCDENGRWSPDPSQLACTTMSAAAAIAITATVCTLIAFITGALCGAVATVCISRWNRKGRRSKQASNTQEQQRTVPVYEEVDTQSQKIELELKENVAYGPVRVH